MILTDQLGCRQNQLWMKHFSPKLNEEINQL